MRIPSAVVSGSLLVAASQAIEGVVQFDIERRQLQPRVRLDKRAPADAFEEVITNDRSRGGYFLTCNVGNPPQNLTLQLDTGSSDIWVPASSACKPSAKKPNGCSLGSCKISPVPSPSPCRLCCQARTPESPLTMCVGN